MKADKYLMAAVIGSAIHNNSNNNSEDEFFKNVIIEDAVHVVKSGGHWVLEAIDGLDVREELGTVSHDVLVLQGSMISFCQGLIRKPWRSCFREENFRLLKGGALCERGVFGKICKHCPRSLILNRDCSFVGGICHQIILRRNKSISSR